MNEELTYCESKGLWLRKILAGVYIVIPLILLFVGIIFSIDGNEDILTVMFMIAMTWYVLRAVLRLCHSHSVDFGHSLAFHSMQVLHGANTRWGKLSNCGFCGKLSSLRQG